MHEEDRRERSCNSGPTVVLSTKDRAEQLAKSGQVEIVAGMVVRDLSNLPDNQRRELVAEAAKNASEKAKVTAQNIGPHADKWLKSRQKKAHLLANSQKQGEDYDEQLRSMFPYARVKFP